jgi:hypothetical protein
MRKCAPPVELTSSTTATCFNDIEITKTFLPKAATTIRQPITISATPMRMLQAG